MELRNNIYLTSISFWYVLGFFYLLLFLYNFFPVKPKSTSFTLEPPEFLNDIRLDVEKHYKPEVDRIILIVIDAIRKDFVTNTNMPYVYSEIQKQEGCMLPAIAEAPTVTMPRIKAMMTGSVPQFVDLILNFASSAITDDSFLHRAKESGKKMIFFGDNTWLRLFPKMFYRSDGTTSFYVTDFTEVDNNVTRHLKRELKQTDWDILFLHYLGLDHIGHVHGPFHPLISHKLQEMDSIIYNIHTTTRQQDKKTVILICGDHGMRDSGGHGGSSEPETVVPLIFLGVSCNSNYKKEIAQTDIAPTLSALMGLQLPADNIGKIIPEVMNLTAEHRLYLLHYNALNLLQKEERYISEFRDIFQKHSDYLKHRKSNPQNLIDEYESKITEISNKLIKSSTLQNVPFLYLSLTALIIILMALLIIQHQIFFLKISSTTIIFTIVLFYFQDNQIVSSLTTCYCFFVLLIVSSKLLNLVYLFFKFATSPILFFLLSGTILRTISLISSSFIEEEHQVWFYLWGTASVFGALGEIKCKRWVHVSLWIILFVGLRITRHLKHIGKWDSIPDISAWLQLPENNIWLNVTFIIGLIGVVKCCNQIFNSHKINILTMLTTLSIFWYRTSLYYDKHTVIEARIAMILILITGIISFVKHKEIFKTLSMMWMLWISLLMRPYNVILISICFFGSKILFKLCSSKKMLLILHIWLAYVLFHCQGFCNFFSSVDVSPGYVGVREYSLFFTSFKVVCHTYTFPMLSLMLLFSNSKYMEQIKMLHFVLIFRLLSVTWYCFCMILHRQHLFIWSVFSPKLLIESCHALLLLIALFCYVLIKGCSKEHRLNVY